MYYIPNTWFNIRPTNNTIHIKVSNVESGNSEIGNEFTVQIAAGDYVDGVVLMQAVINALNQALFDYFKSSGADGHYYRQDLYSLGSNAHIPWLRRQHNWAREQPSTYVVIDESKPKALQEAKEKLHIPNDWDPHRIDGRYVMAYVTTEGYFELERDHSPKYTLDVAFGTIGKLLGYSRMTSGSGLEWQRLFNKGDWKRVRAPYAPNMNANTLNSIWVMCDIVEHTDCGCSLQLPLLRVVPVGNNNTHVLHNFGIPQYRRLNTNRISRIKIWLLEELDDDKIALDIYSDVYIRLEFARDDDDAE